MRKCLAIGLLLASTVALARVEAPTIVENDVGYQVPKTDHSYTVSKVDFVNWDAVIVEPTMIVAYHAPANECVAFGGIDKGVLATAPEFYLYRVGFVRTGAEKLPDIYDRIKAKKLYLLNCQLALK